jgi:hypothetical protein
MVWKKHFGDRSVAGLLALAGLCAGCGSVEVGSSWRRMDILVDGKPGDWGNDLEFVKDLHADLGVVNDDSTLYVCFILRDEDVGRRIALSGLNLWFDPKGGDEKHFGIRFPLGHEVAPKEPRDREGDDRRRDSEGGEWEPRLRDDVVEILGDRTAGPMPVDELPGVRVAVARSASRALVYELALPLQRSAGHPYAIGARPGAVLGVTLDVPAFHRPEPRVEAPGEGGERGRGSGGWRGRGGRSGPRGPGSMGGRGGGGLEAWQARARLKLALPG